MRESASQRGASKTSQSGMRTNDQAVPCEEKAYFECFYAFIGGDFGAQTRDTEFAKTDRFRDWTEYARVRSDEPPRVTRRLRSLADGTAPPPRRG
jgi:hypothetical protein